MKRITLMTKPDAAGLASFLGRNLKEVLGGCVDIQDFYGETQTPAGVLDADIVLVMLRDQIADLGQMMPELRRFLVVHRTLRKSELYRLFAIPEGTRVLVVNDHPVTTMETVALLHELEINHLQFVPFREGHGLPGLRYRRHPGRAGQASPGRPHRHRRGPPLHRHFHLPRDHQPPGHRRS